MSDTIKLAEYLFTRVKQLGAGAIHGVPGMKAYHSLSRLTPNLIS